MEVKEEGECNMIMHGSNVTNYPNRRMFKEIVPHKKIILEHFNPHFMSTFLFKSKGEETLVARALVFDATVLREIVIKAHITKQNGKDTFV